MIGLLRTNYFSVGTYKYIVSDKRELGVPLIWQRQPELLEASTNVFWRHRRTPMGEDLNGRLCGQPRKLVTSAFSAKSFPCSALPIVAGSSTVKLLLRFRPRVFRGIRGRQNDGERPPVRVLAGPMRSRHRIMDIPSSKHQVERIKVIAWSNFYIAPGFLLRAKIEN